MNEIPTIFEQHVAQLWILYNYSSVTMRYAKLFTPEKIIGALGKNFFQG